MADEQGGSVQLFSQCNICVVCVDVDEKTGSDFLGVEDADYLQDLIKDHGGEVVIHEEPAPFLQIEQFTHIISSTVDFPAYQLACDNLVPVVTAQWLKMSISRGKLANPRQFSPDPKLFFRDVVLTCGDIPDGDKDAILGGVIALGGLYSPRVTLQVTHLVDLSLDSDQAKSIISKGLGIKIVLPHWFDDCLKLGRRIDERPYTLPNPEILHAAFDAPIRTFGNADIVGASTPEPVALPTPTRSPHHHRSLSVLEGKCIMLSSDLGIGNHLRGSIEDLIKQGNGIVTRDLNEADMFICRYREGVEYRTASRWNKDVGNLSWLYHLITHNRWTSPLRRLLHYPVPREPIPGFEDLKICLSSYAGEARAYLENLIQATGAEFTKTLKQHNTHLITAHVNSEKYQAAQDWNVHKVNHLWLEESYANWKMLPVSDPRYTHFPRRTNLGEVVGQTKLDRAVLEKKFFPADTAEHRVMQQQDHNIASNAGNTKTRSPKGHSKTATKSSSPALVKTTASATPQTGKLSRKMAQFGETKTPTVSRFMAEGKENIMPSTTSSRKSKEAAAARIHDAAPDIALYEKEMKRVGGVIYGGRRKTDPDLVVPTNNKKRRSEEPEEDEETEDEKTEVKRQKKVRHPVTMHMIITGYQPWVGNIKKEDADKRQLRNLGIIITQDAKKCTHLAAPSILRTPKFVNALAYAPVIVNVDYIKQCLAKDELLDPAKFTLVDKATEKKTGFTLAAARERAQDNKNRLLRGYRICCVETIRGGFDAFKLIVEANGGECTPFRGRVSMKDQRRDSSSSSDSDDEEADHPLKDDVFLVSGEEPDHIKLWPRFRQMVLEIGRTPRIVNVNWLLDTAMSQEICWKEEYEFKSDEDV